MAADKKTAATRAATSSPQAAAQKPQKPAKAGPAKKPVSAASTVAKSPAAAGKPKPAPAASKKAVPAAPPKPPASKAAAKPEPKRPEPKKAVAKAEPKRPEPKKAVAKPEPKKAVAKPEPKKPEPKKPVAKAEPKKPEPKKPEPKKPEPKKAVAKAEPKKAVAKAEPKKERPAPPPPSPFTVGDKVVYPHHGAAVITRKERVVFQGQRTDYFVLEVATDQLILKVPVFSALERGVRPVISRVVARKVLATFKEPPEEAGANWSRWYKLLTEKINSGDIFQVAEVVRDLTFAQQTKGISPALKRMLSKARLILASELRFALDVTEEEAMRRLDKALPRLEAAEEI
jgi:CarD family transcriptional regulator